MKTIKNTKDSNRQRQKTGEARGLLTCIAWVGGRVCGGVMRRGEAIPTAVQCSDEGTCSEANWDACAPRVSVMKCERCGHSYSPPTDEAERQAGKERGS